VKDLEAEKTDLMIKKGSGAVSGVVTAGKGRAGKRSDEDNKANEDLINFLEHKLEEIEKKLSTTQNEYEIL